MAGEPPAEAAFPAETARPGPDSFRTAANRSRKPLKAARILLDAPIPPPYFPRDFGKGRGWAPQILFHQKAILIGV